jgi:GntR family transcriptional repressor for pyruvate dehydrogenase complex
MDLAQHEAIYEAIMAGDAQAAREAAQAHIDFIITATREAERTGEWARISQLRLQQRGGQTGASPARPSPS